MIQFQIQLLIAKNLQIIHSLFFQIQGFSRAALFKLLFLLNMTVDLELQLLPMIHAACHAQLAAE